MRLSRFVLAFLLLASFSLILPVALSAHRAKDRVKAASFHGAEPLPIDSCGSLIASYHGRLAGEDISVASPAADDQPGVKEDVPAKYLVHYQQWKKEFLSTEVGRREWAFYADNPHFKLTIAISRDNPEGATTGDYKWNESGELVAATITLGTRLDVGFPNPVYFPVMNSLVP